MTLMGMCEAEKEMWLEEEPPTDFDAEIDELEAILLVRNGK